MKKEEEKVHGWMYKYICGPKNKMICWQMYILVNKYSNIFENFNICYTLRQCFEDIFTKDESIIQLVI